MNLETLLHPATILFLIGFVFGSMSPQLRHRQKMMFCKFMGDGFLSLYLFSLGGLSGGCGAAIAATGALIQAITPHKYLKQTLWLRMGIALILSVTSIWLVYRTPVDLLPISMVIICRFAELQHQAQRIRIAYLLTCFPWMTYHYLNDFYLPLFACILTTISLSVAIMRHYHPQKPDIPNMGEQKLES